MRRPGRSTAQGWVLDTLLAVGGWDVLHPEVRPFFEELGYNHADIDQVFANVKSGAMLPKAWSGVAAAIQKKAKFYEEAGFSLTARDLYHRAAILWGRAQYSFYADDPRRLTFASKAKGCVEAVSRLNPTPIERVVVDFEGQQLFGILHLPSKEARSAPTVILGPGMDMIKEDYTLVAQRYYVPRGVVALAIEGPGQGETLSRGLKVDLTNYERAVSRFIDYLGERPEVDTGRIGLWGISMGSYWGMRCAAKEKRLKAVATCAGCYGDFDVLFERAQPSFKANFMYMAGYEDEEQFDRELASEMNLWGLAAEIECPVFMGFGEFDELTRIEDTFRLFDMITAPKELVVFGEEFHPLGPVTAELLRYGAEWLDQALSDGIPSDWNEQRYVGRDGLIQRGDARPPWWLGTDPAKPRAKTSSRR